MTNPIRIRVLQLPFHGDELWRHAISAACTLKGWRYIEYWGGDFPELDPVANAVIVGWEVQGAQADTDCWAIQMAEPNTSLDVFQERVRWNDADARYHFSYRLAKAAELVSCGATVSWATDSYLDLPVLGRVAAPTGFFPPSHEPETSGPLSMYDDLSSVSAKDIRWGADLFNYPIGKESVGGVNPISLLSRRRLLLNGPNIWLPAGTWEIRVALEVDPQDSADLLVEWGYGVDTVQLSSVIDVAGRYDIQLAQVWKEPAPADFRISLMMPGLDGSLEFRGLEINKPPSKGG